MFVEGDNEWISFNRFPAENILQFPLGVLEIKLNNEAPDWVMDLVKSGYLVCIASSHQIFQKIENFNTK
jgi:SPX domain protein involved in polyphosphate accumulation